MAISKAATISVVLAVGLLHFTNLHPGIVFILCGVGVTFVYRAVKRCFNFINPMALTGVGAVVLLYYFYPQPVAAFLTGLFVSVITGLIIP